jgi:hypothetical protein
MTAGSWRILLAGCAVIATALPALGQKPSFGELLSRAEAQAVAGHRWTPPGDNMTETVIGMMDLIPTATPEQLTKLSQLLESEKEPPRPLAGGAAPLTREPVTREPVTKEPGTAVATPSSDTRPTPPATGPATAMESAVRPTPPPPGTSAATPAPPANDTAMVLAARPTPPTATPPTATPPTADTTAPARPTPPANAAIVLAARPNPPAADTADAERAGLVPPATASRPGPRATELFARGQQAERQGDISGARRLYSSAAQQGHAMAARKLGRLYDPVYLGQTALGGIDADPAIARQWYARALAMGDAEAGPLVEALSLR